MYKTRPHRVFGFLLYFLVLIGTAVSFRGAPEYESPEPPAESVFAVSQYRSVASGNWNAPASWEVSTDGGLNWAAAATLPTAADDSITIRTGHTITISAAGLSYDQVTVDAGGQVTVAAGIASTLANGTGTDLTINGTWLNSGGTWTTTGTWLVNAGGTYIHNTSSGVATPLNQATLDAASNFIYRGNTASQPAISMSGRTYGNLAFDCSSGSYAIIPSGAGTLTVNGDFTIAACVTYSTIQTGIMTFAGNFTNNGTLTNSTGTQVYTFTGVGKTIGGSSASAFETFNIGAGASVTAASAVTLTSTFTGTVNGTFTAANTFTNNGILNVNGAFRLNQGASMTGNAIAYAAGSTLSYNGTTTQTTTAVDFPASGGPTNLTVNNPGGINLHASRTVGGLNLTAGSVVTGANTLSVAAGGPVSRGSGMVIGTLQRTAAATGPMTFDVGTANGYSPVAVNVTAGTFPSSLTVQALSQTMPGLVPALSATRHWRLTESGDLTADLAFTYLAGDVNGNEADYRVWKRSGAVDTNMCPGGPCVNVLTHTVSVTGVSDFSAWGPAEALVPTAASVSISGRVMTADGRGVNNAYVTLTGPSGIVRTFITGAFGYYSFDNVSAGEMYIIGLRSKRYHTPDRMLLVTDSVTGMDLIAME